MDIANINKCSFGFLIFKSVKGTWNQKVWELMLKACLLPIKVEEKYIFIFEIKI